jgi:prolyl oligopeptidase
MAVPDEVGGVRFIHRDGWLESPTEETRAWVAARDAELRAYLGGTDLTALREDISAELALVAQARTPAQAGSAWFLHDISPVDGSSVIRCGPEAGTLDRALVDSADLPGRRPVIDWAVPSPEGRYVAFSVSDGGDEDGTVHVVDVTTGAWLPDTVEHDFLAPASWLPDESGFFVTVGPAPITVTGVRYPVLHRIGATGSEVLAVPRLGDLGDTTAIVASQDVSLAMVGAQTAVPAAMRRHGSEAWEPVLVGFAGSFAGSVDGDDYVCVTTDGADRGRVVRIPLATARDRDTWTELVGEGEAVIRGVTVVGAWLVTFEILDAAHRVRVFAADGTPDHVVDLPEAAGLDLVFGFGQANGEPRIAPAGDDAFDMVVAGFDRPPVTMRYHIPTRALSALTPVATPRDGIRVERRCCTSPDGTPVWYWQVAAADTVLPAPALAFAYGGFNIAIHTPAYPAPLLPFLRAGGILLLPQLRGGGEQGLRHWQEATGTGKQRTYDDLYAVVEDAVARGAAAGDRVGFVGASNGGLTASVALTQRPELWRAVIAAIPITDFLALDRRPIGALFGTEYGDPREPAVAAARAAISPVHSIRPGTRYPAVLVDVGQNDARCPAPDGYRLVAALAAAQADPSRPILLHERPLQGHVTAEGEVWPMWLAFLMHELGLARRPAST